MMNRILIVLFLLCETSAANMPVVLKSNVTVKSNQLKVSDFFDGVPDTVDQVIMDAPALGTTRYFPYEWVDQLAINFGLTWDDKNKTGLSVSRATYSAEEIAFAETLVVNYINSEYPDKFKNEIGVELVLSNINIDLIKECENPSIVELQWNTKNHFIIKLNTASTPTPISIVGSVVEFINVPVLKQEAHHGHLIQLEDLEYKTLPATKVTSTTLKKSEDIIGTTVKFSSIKAGEPLVRQSLESPMAIKKGDLIQLRVETPTIEISLRAKATTAGCVGDTIQVMNLESKKLVEATVKDQQTAVISIGG
jgi:flagellar basal body P-ring formation protein FlgA